MSVPAPRAAALGAATLLALTAFERQPASADARCAICGAALGAAAAFDLAERRIPNRVTVPALLALLALWAATGAAWKPIAAGLAVASVLAAIGLLAPAAIGMGDAKLALVIAFGLADKALIALACAIVLAASVTAGRLVLAWSDDRARTVPLGPFFALGALIALIA